MLPGIELMGCQGLAVPSEVMHHVVRVESSYNPYAIGVVGGRLVRQPKNLPEALATVRMLEGRGFNFSIGLAQVNRYNLDKYGLDSYEKAFEPCANLKAGSRILAECYKRADGDWGKSFSCYYSGNFSTGFRQGYVQKIYASVRQERAGGDTSPSSPAIEVVGRAARRTVPVARHPLYNPTSSAEQASIESQAVPSVPSPAAPSAAAAPSRTQRVPSRTEFVDPVASFLAAGPMPQATVAETAVPAPAPQPVQAVGRAVPTAGVAGVAKVVASQAASADEPATAKRRGSAGDKAFVVSAPDQDEAFVF
ncbi:MAG: transglycosylase SLT domain-containing protein [Lysobacter sp.]|nr:transglycosylase SLT domain-containing protein [Lysobacter sp.]